MYVVKLARGQWSTILYIGSKEDADATADALNAQYQTDEYWVEAWEDRSLPRLDNQPKTQ